MEPYAMFTISERIAQLGETVTFLRDVVNRVQKPGMLTTPKGNLAGQLEEATRRLEAHAKALPEADEYQGWTNRETWVVNLWLSNDARHYEAVRAAVLGLKAAYPDKWEFRAGQIISEHMDQVITQQDDVLAHGRGGDRMATDLMNAAMARCDWRAIAAAFGEE